MLVCVHCGSAVPTLYHESSKESICLETCGSCGEIADKYVEWDIYITAIDLFLLKVAVFRHLIYNQNATPSDGDSRQSKRRRISRILLLFASAVVLDGYRVMVTCRFLTRSQEWCDKDVLLRQQHALEKSGNFFQNYPIPEFITVAREVSGTHITPFSEVDSTTNLLYNMVQSILASSQIKIMAAREEMGMCHNFKVRSVVDRFFILALDEPSLLVLGNLTCVKFGEWSTLLLCLAKLAGYCTTLLLIHKTLRKGRCMNTRTGASVEMPATEKMNASSSGTDVILAVLLCIHIKALVLMMIIWYPRLPLLGAVEIYAYFSNVLALNAACNMTMRESAASIVSAIGVKMIIHYMWLKGRYSLSV
ncbi:Protein arv1 -like protein [Babesia sp. Xinjiang]|uniref:Protein arv1 -like protein n=1 Tax=Babesia sp. Xinjiang TaxID=462227 RepID=UPI000A21AFED|nr:Protein arv1 -like protein [Babesia sp. Xinjiang]ORM40413.1 Protein arv1 -like protein [Babesia sp. Xinjiang]